ncbi:MAG TPA: caspase family protein [Thermoanaerobaculia bacterium]|nr:caspase family protein [Thermoanaerobaculia bacterium]
MPLKRIVLVLALVAQTAAAAPHRRALLVGINDYSASHLTPIRAPASGRDWPNLAGAVNDTAALRELLVLLHGFDARDVVTLNDQSATRSAILGAANRLAATAAKDDIVLFYFAGHGSQRSNSKSDEPDKLDESIVPADSRRGADDIRDKELRRVFNAILDRGAHLTVIIDACHSGSGARGLLTLTQPRGIRADLRDVADGGDYGPRPENRGALVISAAHDDEEAREVRDGRETMHGAFTWAWMRAMRDATADETAMATFTRAQARLRAEMPFQNPVIAGDAAQRNTPFLGTHAEAARTAFAVERVRGDGTAVISGGWAHGITVGSELRVAGDRMQPPLVVTSLLGLGRCEARIPAAAHVRSGMLLELVGWAAPPPRVLRIAMPHADIDVAAFARRVAKTGVTLIDDPTKRTPDHVLRWAGGWWELVDRAGRATSFDSLARLHGSVFVQLPAPTELAKAIAGPAVLDVVERAEDADYVLVGRFVRNHLEYAWVRPNAQRGISTLPLRSVWLTATFDIAHVLQHRALVLHKIAAWSFLESPGRWPYHLVLHGDREVTDKVAGGETYTLELRATAPLRSVPRRHLYVFTINQYGESTLLFPLSGSVENHVPLAGAPPVIPLQAKFQIAKPYGVDTYFLLTTDEPLTNPWILEWEGVRSAPPPTKTALERLLALTSSSERAARIVTPATWSIERIAIESVPPRRHKR